MAKINVSLYVKRIVFKTRKKEFEPPRLEEFLAKHIKAKQPIRERHHPPLGQIDDDVKHCLFIQGHRPLGNGAFEFSLCSYVPGSAPSQMTQSFDQPQVALVDDPIIDPDTKEPREVVVVAHCLVFGEALLATLPSNLGGQHVIANYLTFLLRKFGDPKHPKVHLLDHMCPKLQKAIELGGGVDEVILKMSHTIPGTPSSRFGKLLGAGRESIGGTNLFSSTFKAPKGSRLSTDDVLEAYEEFNDTSEIDNLVIVLKDTQRIVGNEKLKMRHRVEVSETKGRNPNAVELKRELRDYLAALRTPDENDERILNDDGRFALNH